MEYYSKNENLSLFKAVIPFEKKEDNDVLKISGVASTWVQDRHGESVIGPNAFANLEQFKKNPIMLANHNPDRPLGHYEDISLTDDSLNVTGVVVNKSDPFFSLIKSGSIRTFSIGGRARYEKDKIVEVHLEEISVVTIPANPEAEFSLSKALYNSIPQKTEEVDFRRSFFVEQAETLKKLWRGGF